MMHMMMIVTNVMVYARRMRSRRVHAARRRYGHGHATVEHGTRRRAMLWRGRRRRLVALGLVDLGQVGNAVVVVRCAAVLRTIAHAMSKVLAKIARRADDELFEAARLCATFVCAVRHEFGVFLQLARGQIELRQAKTLAYVIAYVCGEKERETFDTYKITEVRLYDFKFKR